MSILAIKSIVKFDSLSVSLGGVSILDSVTASVPLGSSTAIVGPNGAGKTTLLLALLGQIKYKGSIVFEKDNKLPRIGYVPQKLTFDRGLPLTVVEFMVMGIQKLPLWLGVRKQNRARAMNLLSLVNALDLSDRRLGALSGGELQRVLLALAIQQDPQLLVLDEPAAGVDYHGEHLFCELLEKLRKEHGYTQLMVSHDLGTVSHHASHVICMNKKVAAEGTPSEVLTPEILSTVFGVHMGGLIGVKNG